MPKITFHNAKISSEIPKGRSVLEAALELKVPIYHTCGGNASCSTCRVCVIKGVENLSSIEGAEAQVLDAFDLKPPYRLSCQALILRGDVEVEIPDRAKPPRASKILPVPV